MLWKEWQHYHTTLTNPLLFKQHMDDMKARSSKKRKTLATILSKTPDEQINDADVVVRAPIKDITNEI